MTQRQTVLSMLKRAHKDGVTNGSFAEAGILRYSARIEELRKEGHSIAKQRVSAACWKYTFLPGVGGDPGGTGGGVPVVALPLGGGEDSRVSPSVEPESLFEVEPVRPSHYSEAA